MLVQCTGDQFFAGTGLASDHDRDVALAQTADGAEHVLHGRCLAQHFGRGGHALLSHLFTLAFFDRTADQLHRLGQIKRLGQVLERPSLKGRHRTVQVGKRGHDDHGQARQLLFDLVQQVQARPTRHADVADQHLRAQFIRVVGQCGQHILRIGKTAGGQVFTQQRLFQHKADGLIVINDPDGFHAYVSFLPAAQGRWLDCPLHPRPDKGDSGFKAGESES